jgi:NAD(P)-dependent dehydrogenase (short-subunit alcohol dehydrogenase family)
MNRSTALVTGATSGLGQAAAGVLAGDGWHEVIITGRSQARIKATGNQLATETGKDVFTPLELELADPASVQRAIAELIKRGQAGQPTIDFLLLNAGLGTGSKRALTAAGVETNQAPLMGHHQLTVGLLRANLLSPNARIVIAGAEPARGDMFIFKLTDIPTLAAKHYKGNRTAAIEEMLRSGPNVKYDANRAYADAKVMVAWWAASLARRLPSGMAVYAVSPGSAPDTQAPRHAGPVVKYVMIPLLKLVPGMTMTPEVAARRYIQAAQEFGTDQSGQFWASAPGKLTGSIEAMKQPHLLDRESQEAAWRAIVAVSGVDLS